MGTLKPSDADETIGKTQGVGQLQMQYWSASSSSATAGQQDDEQVIHET